MKDFLLLTLYAPMASWGDIAVGEVRGSWDRPSRSALLGLVAAALGITRHDQEKHDALDRGFGIGVRVDRVGAARGDYQTAQTVSASDIRRARSRTRSTMLRAGAPNTVLSRRWFREDSHFTVALWTRSDTSWSLTELASAFARPTFVLYAGRKAHPFALPLQPAIVAAETLAGALRKREPSVMLQDKERTGVGTPSGPNEVAHDQCEGFPSGLTAMTRHSRRDAQAHRRRWLFSDRTMHVGLLERELSQ